MAGVWRDWLALVRAVGRVVETDAACGPVGGERPGEPVTSRGGGTR
ncbi:hypothetical protein [Agrococcus sp. BE272]|nr:hypothetical protein [Agrococcus sp. BE272]MDR7234151.1 hypothetical protein [Agrococcus sp. BE272]